MARVHRKGAVTNDAGAGEELRRAKERLELALRGANDGIWDWDLATGEMYFSPRWKEILGYADAELENHIDSWRALVHPDDTPVIATAMAEVTRGRTDKVELEYRLRHKDGSFRHVVSRSLVVRDARGDAVRVVGTHSDITDRKAAQASLASAASLLRATLESTADGILVVDLDGRISAYNRRFADMWRIQEEVLASTDDSTALNFVLPQLVDPEGFLDKVHQLYRNADASSFDVLHFKDGRVFERYSQPQRLGEDIVGRVWSFRDVTDARRTEESLRRAQKLDALGTLAGGIAHEFNNLLLAITGNVHLAVADLPPGHPAHTSLAEISRASTRAIELVRRILAFGRPGERRGEALDLGSVVEEALRFVRATLPAMIDIGIQRAPGLPLVVADAGEMHQIIVNLATNAAHAIGQRRGRIAVTLDRADGAPSLPAELAAGDYLHLRLQDNGCGMDSLTLERIFDPFFTTRPTGQGAGLGLSVVHGIMKSCGGAVAVESQPGVGSTVHLYFPSAGAPKGAAAPSLPAPARGRGQRVLYVDDDDALVFLVTRSLTRMGYAVTGCQDPTAALAQFRAAPQEFDVIVTDIAMPVLSGFDLASAARVARPDIPIVMTSGYVRAENRETAARLGVEAVIPKPDTVHELARTLANLFDGRASGRLGN
ncbi:PAS domain-containing protein [Candidatus Binatia bacterium]|nr:PAS domain-containing protein [Candidatus Binatia bacterium]